MSKGVKKVLGFVVAIAIPFVAVPLAGMLAASTGIAAFGGFLGSAAVGAGLGAANAALTGGNVGQGALFGGIGGGLAGAAGGASAFAGAPTAGTAGAAGTAGTATSIPTTSSAVADSLYYGFNTAGNVATPVATTFMEALGQVPSTLAAQFTDPTKLAELTLKAGSMLASGMMTSDPMAGVPEEERQAVELLKQDLLRKQATDQNLFNKQMALANDVINEAKLIDPEYFAQQGAKKQQILGAAVEKQTTEDYSKGLGQTGREAALAAAQQRRRIETGRNASTAFASGLATGSDIRNQQIAYGAGLMPRSAPEGAYGSMLDIYRGYSDRSATHQAGLNQAFGDLTQTLFPPKAKPKTKPRANSGTPSSIGSA